MTVWVAVSRWPVTRRHLAFRRLHWSLGLTTRRPTTWALGLWLRLFLPQRVKYSQAHGPGPALPIALAQMAQDGGKMVAYLSGEIDKIYALLILTLTQW